MLAAVWNKSKLRVYGIIAHSQTALESIAESLRTLANDSKESIHCNSVPYPALTERLSSEGLPYSVKPVMLFYVQIHVVCIFLALSPCVDIKRNIL